MFERFKLFKQETKSVTLDSLPDFLDQNSQRERYELEEKIGPIVQDIRLNFSYIKSISSHLKTKTSSNKYSDMLKDKFCDKSLEAVDGLDMRAAVYEDMTRFLLQAKSSLDVISGISVKEFKHLVAFKDDVGKVAESIRHIETKLAIANKSIQNSSLPKFEEIKKQIRSIDTLKRKILEIDNEIISAESVIASANDTVIEQRTKLDEINVLLSDYGPERIKIKEMEKALENITSQINKEFAGMDRVIKKFVYFGELSKEETSLIKDYINDFAETFLEKDDNNMLISILDSIHSYKDRNMIDLDEKKAEKIVELVRHFDFLVELRRHYREIKQTLTAAEKELEEKFEPLKYQLKEAMALLTSKEKDIINLQNKISAKKSEKVLIQQQIIDSRNRIELGVGQLLGNQIKIV